MDQRLKASAVFDLGQWMADHLARVERSLESWVSAKASTSSGHTAPADLIAAMRYAVLDGGKRLRPLLVLAAYEAAASGMKGSADVALNVVSSGHDAVLRAACAVEIIHAYSLVHDDMPCMDNDVLRRGKPTVHVKFGEAQALLAGDALQALAFELLTPDTGIPEAQQARLCRLLAQAAGSAGMAGGQAIDLASVGATLSESQLREMHRLKTGALLQASVMMGTAFADLPLAALNAMRAYGAAIGLAFQVVDDILDVTSDSATLGKTAGKDANHDKPTYVSVLGLARSGMYAQELLEQALTALARGGLRDTQALQGLANMVVRRTS
ncbi:MAG: polyprenyl synthetase family protein [Comamonadaceae bacterium]